METLNRLLDLDPNRLREELQNYTVADLAAEWYILSQEDELKIFLALDQPMRGSFDE